jgi:hypothetical protein
MKKMIACLAIQALVAGASFAQMPPMPPTTQNVTPQAPKTGLLDAKTALCQIDALLSPIDGIPVPAVEAALCRPSYSIETLPKYISNGGSALDFAELGRDLEAYFLFRAMTFSSPDQCAPLGQLREEMAKTLKTGDSLPQLEQSCRSHYDEIRLAGAVITHDPQLGAICLASMGKEHGGAQLCPKIVANAGSLSALTAAACEGGPDKRKKCVDSLRVMFGDATACQGSSGDHKAICLSIAAFAKAGPAKNPALCRDDSVCLAMSGSAVKASVRAARLVAGDVSSVLFKEAQEKLRVLDDATDPMNAAAAKEIDAREDRIAALQLKLDPRSRKALKGTAKEPDGAQEK